jgi:Abortive infection C-terminus
VKVRRVSDLTFLEKHKLEKLLGMVTGYVLDFSNRTFSEFVADSTGRNIYDSRYDRATGSKANRLRAFWSVEPNHLAGKLTDELLEYSKTRGLDSSEPALFAECKQIAARLRTGGPVPELAEISPNADDNDFDLLARAVRDAIDRNEPQTGLDRLHAFVVRYVRTLCEKRGLTVDRSKPLHSLFGEYVRKLRDAGLIESEMTERILKSSISVLEAFSAVRNDRSLAHANPLLNYDESLLIFSHVTGSIKFIRALEERSDRLNTSSREADPDDEDISF